MSRFKYSDDELDINKVLKMNQDNSDALLNDLDMKHTRSVADSNIDSSIELLRSLGLLNCQMKSKIRKRIEN